MIEAEFPASIIDARLRHAQEIIEELLKPVVSDFYAPVRMVYLYLLDYSVTPLPAAHWKYLYLRDLYMVRPLLISRINSAGNAI